MVDLEPETMHLDFQTYHLEVLTIDLRVPTQPPIDAAPA